VKMVDLAMIMEYNDNDDVEDRFQENDSID